MELRALVQGRFPFGGVMRKPGDVIEAEELALCSPQARDALVSQKLIVLTGDKEDGAAPHAEVAHLQAQVEALREANTKLEARVVELTGAFEKGGAEFQSQIDGLRTAIRSLAPAAPRAPRAPKET